MASPVVMGFLTSWNVLGGQRDSCKQFRSFWMCWRIFLDISSQRPSWISPSQKRKKWLRKQICRVALAVVTTRQQSIKSCRKWTQQKVKSLLRMPEQISSCWATYLAFSHGRWPWMRKRHRITDHLHRETPQTRDMERWASTAGNCHRWTVFQEDLQRGANKELTQGTHIICVFKARIRKAKAQLELKLVRDVKGKDKGIYKYTSCKRKSEVNGNHCLVGQETVTNLVNSKITCACTPISFVEDCPQDAQVPAASGNVTKETQHSPALYPCLDHLNMARIKLASHLSVFHSLPVSNSLTQPHCEP